MKRRLLNLLTALSLLLCVATLTIWIHSFRSYDLVGRGAYSGLATELIAMRGRLVFSHFNSYSSDPPPTEWSLASWPVGTEMARRLDVELGDLGPHWWNRLGFFALRTDRHPTYKRLRVACVPLWLPAPAFAAAPTAWLVRRGRARNRTRDGRCPACGYDLTGKQSATCPECGPPAGTKMA